MTKLHCMSVCVCVCVCEYARALLLEFDDLFVSSQLCAMRPHSNTCNLPSFVLESCWSVFPNAIVGILETFVIFANLRLTKPAALVHPQLMERLFAAMSCRLPQYKVCLDLTQGPTMHSGFVPNSPTVASPFLLCASKLPIPSWKALLHFLSFLPSKR